MSLFINNLSSSRAMADSDTSETFEVSITSIDGNYIVLPSSLQSVSIKATFQSLFDRLISPHSPRHPDPMPTNLSIPPEQTTMVHSFSSGSMSLDVDIKHVECECFTTLKSSQETGCKVSMDMNIASSSKRHQFLRIVYRIDIPSTPPPLSSTSSCCSSAKQSREKSESEPSPDDVDKSRNSPPSNRYSKV